MPESDIFVTGDELAEEVAPDVALAEGGKALVAGASLAGMTPGAPGVSGIPVR